MSDIIATWGDIKSHYGDESSYDDSKCMTKSEIKNTIKPIDTTVTITNDSSYSDNQLVPLSKINFGFIAIQTDVRLTRMYSFTGSYLTGNYKELESVDIKFTTITWDRNLGLNGSTYFEGNTGLSGSVSELTCSIDGVSKSITTVQPGSGPTTLLGSFWVPWGGTPSIGSHLVRLQKNTNDFYINYLVNVIPGDLDPGNLCTIIIQNPSVIPSTGGLLQLKGSSGLISTIYLLNTINTYSTSSIGSTITGWTDQLQGGSTRTVTPVSGGLVTTSNGYITIKLN